MSFRLGRVTAASSSAQRLRATHHGDPGRPVSRAPRRDDHPPRTPWRPPPRRMATVIDWSVKSSENLALSATVVPLLSLTHRGARENEPDRLLSVPPCQAHPDHPSMSSNA